MNQAHQVKLRKKMVKLRKKTEKHLKTTERLQKKTERLQKTTEKLLTITEEILQTNQMKHQKLLKLLNKENAKKKQTLLIENLPINCQKQVAKVKS